MGFSKQEAYHGERALRPYPTGQPQHTSIPAPRSMDGFALDGGQDL